MADQGFPRAGIVDDWDLGRRHLTRVEAFDGFFAGSPPNVFGIEEIFCINRTGEFVIPFHARALTRNNRCGEANPAPFIGLGEAIAGHQGNAGPAPGGFGAFGVGDAGYRACSIFGTAGPIF